MITESRGGSEEGGGSGKDIRGKRKPHLEINDSVIAHRVSAEIVSVRISDSYCTRNTDIIALSIRSPNAAGTA